jgi:acetylornithine/succinyldiaminopimelate/putrescine aminotransferase
VSARARKADAPLRLAPPEARRALEVAIGPLPCTFEEIVAAEDGAQVATYAKLPIALVEGRGCRVTDSAGRTYLDLYGGHAVAIVGHGHPRLVAALHAQAERLLFYSNVVYNDVRAAAAQRLVTLAPEGLRRVFLCNSGTEANETALKIARKHTGRRHVVSVAEGFHGRTLGSLGATGLPGYRDPSYPVPGEHRFVPYGDGEALRAAVDGSVAAVIFEPIPSVGGIRVAEDAWFRAARERCDETGALLVFDEVQTGLGRTGTWFFGEGVGVTPDLITMAKGIAGGFPAGGVFVREDVAARMQKGEQGTTFGGGPLAAAAIAATAAILVEEDLARNARDVGSRLVRDLAAVPGVVAVHGRGLMLGVDLDRPGAPVVSALLEAGHLVGGSGKPEQIRLLPPLTLGAADADEFTAALAGVLARRG